LYQIGYDKETKLITGYDLSMQSLQKRCKHSITVLVFRIIPAK
jgi:hypothetical protein